MASKDTASLRLNPAQRSRVDALLDEVFDLPESQRLGALAGRAEDPAVLAEVQSLLRASQASGAFLSSPPKPAADPVQETDAGRRIGVWRITRVLGRGGMGEVYEALRDDGSFDQKVAIKLLQVEAAAQLERFQSERQILARLEHPSIARLYDGGVTADGRPYMVMEYVEGRPITEYCELQRCDLKQRLALFEQVCGAVAYAHRNLIVHRDLKASNILVTAEGTVKLLDFGIAKLLDEQRARLTQAAAAPLTPICAAPEQLTGGAITTATDVYALGLLLFELLTGAHPWIGGGTPVLQAMRTVLNKPAPVASVFAADRAAPPVAARLIRGDFDAILAKALRTEPEHRYTTVAAFSEDLSRAERGEPVEARAGATLYTAGRILRRYRFGVVAVGAVLVALAAGLGIAAYQAREARIERDAARRDASREEAVRYNLTRLFRTAIADSGNQTTTAKGMIDSSAERVLKEYQSQPQLLGELVISLADLYGALEDVNGAGALLEGFINSNPRVDPAVLADARQKLANIELLRGHTDQSAQLLDQARAFWDSVPNGYREERLEYLTVRIKLERAQGDVAGAIVTTRDAIAQRMALSGHDHRETAILYNSLGIALASIGQLRDALQAYRETLAIYTALGTADTIDAQIVVANSGVLEMRQGHLQEAEVLLKRATERERSLAGDSAAVAAAMSYYGRLLTVTNRAAPAVSVLRESSDMATKYAGPDSPVAVQSHVFLGEAYLVEGDTTAGAALLRQTYDGAKAHFGPAHPLTLRSESGCGEAAVASGDFLEARRALTEATAGMRKLGAAGEAILAQSLELLGDAELGLNDPTGAQVALREAVQIREKQPDDLWELAGAQARLGEALLRGGQSDGAPLLRKAAADLESQLGASHPQTLRARRALTAT